MDAYKNNKWLIIKDREVLLNETIEPVIVLLDKYFEAAKVKAYVTSGERTSEDQLEIIRAYCYRNGIEKEFPEIKTCEVLEKVEIEGVKYFKWQHAWSKLLNIGVIINPPLPAKALFDYFRNGVNKKGQTIGYSPHYWGKAFDIGGGLDHDIANEQKVVEQALKDGVPGLVGFLPERKNNCLHIDCRPMPIKSKPLLT